MLFVNMEVKSMVRVCGVMRMAVLCFGPSDDLAHVLDDGFTFSDVLQGKNALAMHTRAAGLNAAAGRQRRGLGSF